MKLTAAEFAKWNRWMETIKSDVHELVEFRAINERFEDVVARNIQHLNRNGGGQWCYFIRRNFGAYAAMAVRRHVKANGDSISFSRLLNEIRKCTEQFTYDRFLEFFPLQIDSRPWQQATFDQFSDNGRVLSSARIDADLDKLCGLCATIEEVADRRIAHIDKRGVNTMPSFDDLNIAVELLDGLVCKYRLLLTGISWGPTLESIKLVAWEQVFSVPLDKSAVSVSKTGFGPC